MGDVNSDDYYRVLGVDKSASEKDIAKAYKKAALKWHPDKNPDGNTEDQFKKVTEAYEVLSDKEKRRTYDQFGKQALNGAAGPNMNGGGRQMNFQDAEQIFKAFFGPSGGIFEDFGGGPGRGGRGGSMFMDPFGDNSTRRTKKSRINQDFPDRIPENQKVQIRGLRREPQHNGQNGVVEEYDEDRGRYKVRLQDGQELLLKPDNLSLRVENVRIVGLAGHAQLNGQAGTVISFDSEKDRYTVQVRTASSGAPGLQVVAVPTANIVLPLNTRVTIVGLQGHAQYNGKWGKITEYNQQDEKYTVQLTKEKCIRVKRNNCRAAG